MAIDAPSAAQRRDLGQIGLGALHGGGLGELQLDHRQRHILVGEGGAQAGEEIDAVELARADVEGEPAIDALALPFGQGRGGLGDHPVADLGDDARSARRSG